MLRLVERLFDENHQKLNHRVSYADLKETINPELRKGPQTPEEIENFIDQYIHYSVNTGHDYYANQLWSKVDEASVLGELLASMTNTSMYTYEVAPVATLLERSMINFLSEKVWSESCDGVMTSGGTASNLQALLTARNFKLDSKGQGLVGLDFRPVFLAADNSHYSVKRAANILGLGHQALVEVETNAEGQMTVDAVEEALSKLSSDQRPFCLVSTAGTTVEGSYDDLKSLGEFCQRHKLWFHVDGAYGASALLGAQGKELMKGIELSDSLSWDFHKMLGVNLPCAFLLMKEKGYLKTAITSNNDSYLFHDQDEEMIDLGPSSLQCGRRNDILKLWLTWMAHGEEGFSSRVDRLFQLARDFADEVKERPEFELVQSPQSINVCFRYVHPRGERIEQKIRETLIQSGQLMINYSSDSEGDFFRMAVTNPDLNREKISILLDRIAEVADGLC
ncbi:MAG: aminotransferase class I/II-fold pyridoxal phosphate-dependent enzyme [Pseudomonadota bacterium]